MGVIFLLHATGLAFLFVPVTGLFDHQPVIEQDWGLHFHHLKSMEEFWRHDRQLWGYNPLFMAGYPSNTIQDLSIKLFEFLSLSLSALGLDVTQAFKLTVYIATASVPWMIFFAARNFFDDEARASMVAPLAAFLGTLYWWNSYPREMFFYGMIGFPLSSYFSLLALSLLYRMLQSERVLTPAHWGWIAGAVILLPLHLQAVLILAPPAIALLVADRGTPSRRRLLWIGVGAGVSLSANWVWLSAVFTHRGDDVYSTIVGQLSLFASSDPLTFLKDYLKPGGYWTFRTSFWENGLRWALLIVGTLGAIRLIRSERRDLGVMIGCGALFLFILAYFGSFIPALKSLQPLRFKIPCDLFLVLTSAWLVGAPGRPASSKLRSLLIPALLVCGVITALINLIQTESKDKMRLRTQISPEVRALVEWIRNETPTNGRVLFEESGDETGFFYQGMYLSSFIPHWTGRQLIGGPINLYNDRHHFAEFHSGILFKRDIVAFTGEELAAYFRAYNIGAVVAFHPQSVQRLLASDLVSPDRRLGDLYLMRVNQSLNWFLQGKGELGAGFNRIHASAVSGNEVILKYHWTEGLVSNPPAAILPEKVLDDPIPFIKIVNPPSQFTLRIGG